MAGDSTVGLSGLCITCPMVHVYNLQAEMFLKSNTFFSIFNYIIVLAGKNFLAFSKYLPHRYMHVHVICSLVIYM